MTYESRYSLVDRLLHRVAFRTAGIQVELSGLETSLCGGSLSAIEIRRPVFVTGLPRAGTTLLLELLDRVGEFASHRYRDMPLLLLPLWWGRFSSTFRRAEPSRERAHGDGLSIDLDSPEALEEVVWKVFWARHYAADRIRPWRREPCPAFAEFFETHMRKIIALRRAEGVARASRYVSKNNLNIARIGVLLDLFADGTIVVPHREPLAHAASLLRQHVNFLSLHRADPFSREYMEGIGHYDFGANLRPVDFGGWIDSARCSDPLQPSFWVEYWTATYRHLLTHDESSRVHFVSYERLCSEPRAMLAGLAEAAGLAEPAALADLHDRVSARGRPPADAGSVDADVLAQARDVHASLLARSP